MTDRELDALVAEKVMGWDVLTTREFHRHGKSGDVVDCGDDGIFVAERDRSATTPFNPSTSISAAWSVVEQMRELGWHIDLDNDGSQKIGAEESWTWNALLWTDRDDYDGDGDGDWPTAHADTAPRAICLAALRAVGVEVES